MVVKHRKDTGARVAEWTGLAARTMLGLVLPVTIGSLERYSLLGELASVPAMPSVPSPAIEPSRLNRSSHSTMGA